MTARFRERYISPLPVSNMRLLNFALLAWIAANVAAATDTLSELLASVPFIM